MNTDAEKLLADIVFAVKECGRIMLEADRSGSFVDEKSGHANFVTTYDKLIQKCLKEKLDNIFPEAGFMGEEEDIHDNAGKEFVFIVDPIDGTTNFIKDLKASCISVGLVKNGMPFLGVVYNPYLDEVFTAIKGQGAFCNGKPIHVSKKPLSDGIVIFGTSPYYEELSRKSFELAYELFKKSLDVRRSGTAAIDLCNIAAGRAELFFELKLSPWDYAAGSLLVTEAGGKICTVEGKELNYFEPCSVMAGNPDSIKCAV